MIFEEITRCPNCHEKYRTPTVLSLTHMHSASRWWNSCNNDDCQSVLEVRVRPFVRADETLVKAENKARL